MSAIQLSPKNSMEPLPFTWKESNTIGENTIDATLLITREAACFIFQVHTTFWKNYFASDSTKYPIVWRGKRTNICFDKKFSTIEAFLKALAFRCTQRLKNELQFASNNQQSPRKREDFILESKENSTEFSSNRGTFNNQINAFISALFPKDKMVDFPVKYLNQELKDNTAFIFCKILDRSLCNKDELLRALHCNILQFVGACSVSVIDGKEDENVFQIQVVKQTKTPETSRDGLNVIKSDTAIKDASGVDEKKMDTEEQADASTGGEPDLSVIFEGLDLS